MPEIETLLNESDAAAILNVAVHTLRNWRAAGRGPSVVKIGSCVRYSPSGLRDYIESRTRQPVSSRRIKAA